MRYFWGAVVKPALMALKPKSLVEVGAAGGGHTQRLAQWAANHDAVLHVIDPKPRFDVEALKLAHGQAFVMHQLLSTEALPMIEHADMVLIDGDHNWFTVNHELHLIDQGYDPWPVTLMHDVDWPYGRRDMYYDPNSIPARYRHPYQRSGLVRGRSSLGPDGRNGGFANASHEGGPRNGVLTAVEDFLDASARDLHFFAAPGPGGLGMLIERRTLEAAPELCGVVERAEDVEFASSLTTRASHYFHQLGS